MKRVGFAAVCALVADGLSAYQQPDEVRVSAHPYAPPPLHLTVQSQLVQLDAAVRDSRGRLRRMLEAAVPQPTSRASRTPAF